ncbi:pectate lyase [Sphingobacterium bovistauri]|uniref:Pectate lyase n=1 Tax=Sphingobacterium bovistauri TaxID=2781959 RepID=A0ABS7Z1H3_9SPHI|nr:pectate lyase [Sphingobacterium bovistauri]MCA5004010.1 pectate lyase [Sphingobacterium bovistauri]
MMKTRVLISLIGLLTVCSCKAQKQDSKQTDRWDRILVYQLPNGGWPKHYTDGNATDYSKSLTKDILNKIVKEDKAATIDNRATTKEIEELVEAYQKTGKTPYKEAVIRGVAYLLAAQYANGGFPQYYPDTKGYRSQITFNDNAMINALTVLRNVSNTEDGYNFISEEMRQKANLAVQKGVSCILKTQVLVNGEYTIWAAQYDEHFKPAQARKFEPVALATGESVGVVRFLMKEKPTQEIITAIEGAVKWFEKNQIAGYSFEIKQNANGKVERNLVVNPDGVVWSRFYEIGTNRPIFGDRDDAVHYDFNEISEERKNGYSWYGNWASNLLQSNYPKWLKSINSNTNK